MALSPDTPEWYAQMVSVPVLLADVEAAQQRLYREFAIEVPVMKWNEHRLLRVSVQIYNTKADVDALVSAVARLISAER